MRLVDVDMLDSTIYAKNSDELTVAMVKIVKEYINKLPTIDTQPIVHAKWIGEEFFEGEFPNDRSCQECSNCHRIRPVDYFCSNCGAKMDGD